MARHCDRCNKKLGIMDGFEYNIDGEGIFVCRDCYEELNKQYYEKDEDKLDSNDQTYSYRNQINHSLGVSIAGAIVFFITIIAGIDLLMLRTEAGNTIMEAYYNGVGLFIIALSILILCLIYILDKLVINGKERKIILEDILRELKKK